MEKYTFSSNLLIVAPEFAGVDFKWIDTIKGESQTSGHTETVNILAFNVKSTDEIKPMLEKELETLHAIEAPEEQAVHNMAYIESIIREMEQVGFVHDAPEALLETCGRCARRPFYQKDVIYLSGITAIEK